MRRHILIAIAVPAILAPAAAQTGSISMGTNDQGEEWFIEARTVANIEYPKPVSGIFTVPPQMATYRETWVRAAKDGKTTGQYLWLFDCRGSFAEMASPASDMTARAKSVGVESSLRRIPPGSFLEIAAKHVCKK